MRRIAPMVYFLLILVVVLMTGLGLVLKRQQQQTKLYQISCQQLKESQLQREQLEEQLQLTQLPQNTLELESSIEGQVQARLSSKLKELELWEEELANQEASLEPRQALEMLNRQLQSENAQLQQKNASLEQDVESLDELVRTEADRQVLQTTMELQDQIEQLRSWNTTLQSENQRLYRQSAQRSVSLPETEDSEVILLKANEIDLYDYEKLGFILDILTDTLQQTTKKQERRQDILTDLVQSNPNPSVRIQIKSQLKQLFKGYRVMNRRLESDLNRLGFEIHSENDHYKLHYKSDSRYSFVISKTASDRRVGHNIASQITNKLL